jgi:hypothetical protein
MVSYKLPVFAKCAAIAVWFWRNGELALTGLGYPGVIQLTGKWTHGCKFVSGLLGSKKAIQGLCGLPFSHRCGEMW